MRVTKNPSEFFGKLGTRQRQSIIASSCQTRAIIINNLRDISDFFAFKTNDRVCAFRSNREFRLDCKFHVSPFFNRGAAFAPYNFWLTRLPRITNAANEKARLEPYYLYRSSHCRRVNFEFSSEVPNGFVFTPRRFASVGGRRTARDGEC